MTQDQSKQSHLDDMRERERERKKERKREREGGGGEVGRGVTDKNYSLIP